LFLFFFQFFSFDFLISFVFGCQFISLSSRAPLRTRPFNKLVFDFLDIEAEQGKDSDRLSI
jgi:hypothetical protein